jgi:hypothetical protein
VYRLAVLTVVAAHDLKMSHDNAEHSALDFGPSVIPLTKSETPPPPKPSLIVASPPRRSQSALPPRTAPLWRQLARAGSASRKSDAWADMTARVPAERALKHTYDVSTNSWSAKPVLVKLDTSQPVAHGAMRACFKMKMLRVGKFACLYVILPAVGTRSTMNVRDEI